MKTAKGQTEFALLIPDEHAEIRRRLEQQFREFVELDDEAGYWAWLSLQPGFDPECLLR